MAEVILKNIRKVYDKDVVAVDDANIEIKDKEFVVPSRPFGLRQVHDAANDRRA